MPKWLYTSCVIAILSGVFSFGLWQAATLSDTTDEMIHVAGAYLAQTRGEYRFDPEHPPLFKHLTALPLHALSLNNPEGDLELWNNARVTTYDSWKESRTWSERWVHDSNNPTWLMVFLSRLAGVIALTALCAVVWAFTKRYIGDTIALLALFFTAATPTLLAHGALTNTDVPVALAAMLLVWALYAYHDNRKPHSALLVGLALGAAVATKFSAVVLIPVALGWFIYSSVSHKRSRRAVAGDALIAGVAIFFVIWASYGFRSAPVVAAVGEETLAMQLIREWVAQRGINLELVMEYARLILPLDWLKGAVLALGAGITGRGTYLLSTVYGSGFFLYFPILLLLKTQLVAIFLLLWGAVSIARKKLMGEMVKTSPLIWLLVSIGAVALAAGMASKLSIGIRHISMLMPILAIALAAATYTLVMRITEKQYRTIAMGLIVISMITPITLQAGNMIGFGNALTVPVSNRWQLMADSNLDWGQQLYELERVSTELVRDNPGSTLYINWPWNAYALRSALPEAQGFEPSNPPRSGYVAVTATQLTQERNSVFRNTTPLRVLNGGSLLIYNAADL